MPLLKFDIIQGRNDEQLKACWMWPIRPWSGFEVPASDRYQCVTQHRPGDWLQTRDGLHALGQCGLADGDFPTASTARKPRSTVAAERLQADCDLSPDDLIVSLVENADADWSFGRGGRNS